MVKELSFSLTSISTLMECVVHCSAAIRDQLNWEKLITVQKCCFTLLALTCTQ